MTSSRSGSLVAGLCALAVIGASTLAAQNLSWPAEGMPAPLAPREVPFPQYDIRALANGLQVMTVLHHEQPAVTMHLLIRAGAAQDPEQKDGAAFLVAQLLDQGTTTRTASQIADQIDSIGGSMGTSAQQDRTVASAIVMKDSFDVGLSLLADIVRNPAFDSREIERQKEQLVSLLQVNADDPDYIANAVFDRLVFGLHPYGLPGTGTPQSIATITRADLVDFHRRYFAPNNMILAIVGDVTNDEAFGAAQKVFGSWPRAEVPAPKPMEPPAPARRVIVIDKPDAVQTEIRVGQLAIPRKHPDYLPWDLAVRVLGGEGANRLHGVLRSERGLTYGASAEIDARREAGDFVAETDTRTETTGEALRIIRDELVRLQRDPVSTRELSGAQAYLAGSFPLTIETPNDIAVQVLNAVFYELPLTEIGTFHTRVVSVTPDDVQRVARQYIRPDRLSVVLVGNAKAFVPQLRAAGFPDFEVIPLGDLDLGSPTLSRTRIRVSNETPLELAAAERLTGPRWILASAVQTAAPQTAAPRPAPTPARPSAPAAPAPAQPSSVQARTESAGSDLLRRVIDARGGLEALKAVRSVVADADTVFLSERGDEAVRSTTKTYVLYPDKVRIDATIQGSAVSQILNGGRAWEVGPAGLRDLPPAARDEAAASVRRDTISLLVAAAEGRLSARAFSLDGQRVLEISGTNLDPVRLVIDAQDAILKQRYSTRGPTGKPVSQEEAFADYRIVSGVRMPFQASLLQDGRPIVRRTLTKVVINGPMDPSIFDRPREALK